MEVWTNHRSAAEGHMTQNLQGWSPSEAFHECVLQPTILDVGNKKPKCVCETPSTFLKTIANVCQKMSGDGSFVYNLLRRTVWIISNLMGLETYSWELTFTQLFECLYITHV